MIQSFHFPSAAFMQGKWTGSCWCGGSGWRQRGCNLWLWTCWPSVGSWWPLDWSSTVPGILRAACMIDVLIRTRMTWSESIPVVCSCVASEKSGSVKSRRSWMVSLLVSECMSTNNAVSVFVQYKARSLQSCCELKSIAGSNRYQ